MPTAIETWSKALEILKTIKGTERDQADCYKNIGVVLWEMSKYEEAIAKQEQALSMYQTIKGTERQQADCYRNIGVALDYMGKYEEAIAKQEQALGIYQTIKGTERQQAGCYTNIGVVLWNMGKYEEAIAKQEQALSIYQTIKGTERDQADCYKNIGLALWEMSKYEEAIAKQEQALGIYQTIKGTESEQATCYRNIGIALGNMGKYEEAIAEQEQALQIYQTIKGTERQQADCYTNIGVALDYMGKYEEAIAKQEQALSMYQTIKGIERQQADCYTNIGVVLWEMSKYEEAIAKQEQALSIYQTIKGTERQQAICYKNIGVALDDIGKYEEGIAKQEQALSIYQTITGTERDQADCYKNIGVALLRMGKYEEAIAKQEQAFSIYQTIKGTERDQADCYRNIGVALDYMDKYEDAIAKHQQAFRIYQTIKGTERDQADCYINIGVALDDIGKYEEAIARQEQAFRIFKTIKGTEGDQGACWGNIGEAHLHAERFSKAITAYQRAREFIYSSWLSRGLGLAYRRRSQPGDKQKAVQAFRQAVQLAEEERASVLAFEHRAGVFEEPSKAFAAFASLLVELAEREVMVQEPEVLKWTKSKDPRTACLEIAWHYADAGKGRTLVDMLTARSPKATDPKARTLMAESQELLNQIGKLFERKQALPADAKSARVELDNRIAELEQRRRQIEFELRKTGLGGFATLEFPTAAEVREQLPQQTALLEYVVTEDESLLLLMTREGVTAYTIPVREKPPRGVETAEQLAARYHKDGRKSERDRARSLLGLVKLYRAPLEKHAPDSLPEMMCHVGLELGKLLLPEEAREMLDKADIKHLVIVPDRVLCYLPFNALPLGPREGITQPKSLADCRFLVEDYAISYLPAWTILDAIQIAASTKKVSYEREFVALADPLFSETDPRAEGDGSPDDIQLAMTLRGYYDEFGWKRLKESAAEARLAAEPFSPLRVFSEPAWAAEPKAKALIFEGRAATADVLSDTKARRLLLATHGLVDDRNPWLSCVLLSPRPEQGYAHPVYLKASDIVGLNLDSELVVASACETGLGRVVKGEGMIGLTSAFFMAGCRSLALTLWKVPSGETAEISADFFKREVNCENRAEALRQAQLAFLEKNPDKRHPFYWAAFQLNGDWRK